MKIFFSRQNFCCRSSVARRRRRCFVVPLSLSLSLSLSLLRLCKYTCRCAVGFLVAFASMYNHMFLRACWVRFVSSPGSIIDGVPCLLCCLCVWLPWCMSLLSCCCSLLCLLFLAVFAPLLLRLRRSFIVLPLPIGLATHV